MNRLSPRLPPRLLAAYAAPALPLAALYFPVFIYLAPFYAAERGVDLAALGAVLIAIRLMDAVTDPVMGWVSDSTGLRFGRRRLWVLVSVPLIVIAGWQAMVPPEEAGLGHAALWLGLLTLGWTMAMVPYAAWGAELADDYAGRVRVTGWREGVVIAGTVASAILYDAFGQGGPGLMAVAVAIGVGMPLAVLLAVSTVPDPQPIRTGPRVTLRAGIAAMRRNAPFRRLLLAYVVNGLANGLPVSLFLFYVGHVLGSPQDGGWLIVLYFIAAIAGLPFWSWLARRISKHRAWGVAMVYASLVFLFVLGLGTGDVLLFAVISALTGFALGADMALPPAIQADVVDLDTAETGERRAGVYFAVWSVATKASVAISSGVALMILGFAGFDAEAASQTPEALWVLTLLYAAAPVVLKLGAVAIMWGFPLDRAAQEALQARIEPNRFHA